MTRGSDSAREKRWRSTKRFSLLVKINGEYHAIDAVCERDKLHLHIDAEQSRGYTQQGKQGVRLSIQIERSRLAEHFIEDVLGWLGWHDYLRGAPEAFAMLGRVADHWEQITQEREQRGVE